MNSLPKTVTRQSRGCDLNPGPSAPESSTLTTQLLSHLCIIIIIIIFLIIAVESLGPINCSSVSFLCGLDQQIAKVSGETRDGSFLFFVDEVARHSR